jgi:NAD(P)-dependent dehydrogenase (short-subunit alcohol dehydrogenase family)
VNPSKHGRREFLALSAGALALAACRGEPRERGASAGANSQESKRMQGKTCLVTGATSGLGAVAATELARMGATVIVGGRNASKCATQADEIRRATGARVETAVADLASMQQVRRMAAEVADRFERLDVLVNNAGTVLYERTLTPDGFEKTFAVNYLAPFLLTNLLLDRLKASPAARVVNVSSTAHANGTIDFENLQGERRYERLDAYGRSKLALLMFTYELARRLQGTTVTANAIHPGVVATELGAEGGMKERLRVRVRNLTRRSMLTPEEGGRYLVHAASAPELAGVTGRYLDRGQDVRSSAASYDEAVQRKLWAVTEQLTARWMAAR